ncbi:MAG: hypothetical protein KDA89_11815 [Planctomycetaceae bacterium]|nr:hypothetical protein [Planctomycetaceae bacterium]
MRKAISEYLKTIAVLSECGKSDAIAISRSTSEFHPETQEDDLQTARTYGLDPKLTVTCDHDSIIRRARKSVAAIRMEDTGIAFVAGLPAESVIWRGVLRAYAVCRSLPTHKPLLDEEAYEPPCGICGQPLRLEWCPVEDGASLASSGMIGIVDESVSLLSAAMCLEWFRGVSPPALTSGDWKRVSELFNIIDRVPASTTGSQLAKNLKSVIAGPDAEREAIVETLGFAGVLVNPLMPGDMQAWTNWNVRPFGKGKNVEMYPPSCGWRREFGVDAEVFSLLFPKAKLPKTLVSKR